MDNTTEEMLQSMILTAKIDIRNSISIKFTGLTNYDMLVHLNKNIVTVKNIFKEIATQNEGFITAS